ncbi:MAG: hypothetical protein ACREIQ_05185 [Nitrospiria bacterium]
MKYLKAEYSDGRKTFTTLCDECMAEADGISPIGMWSLDCGHNLCDWCTDYGRLHNKKPHIDVCPGWKLGQAASEEDPTEKKLKIQMDLQRKGYSISQGGVWSPI